MGNTTTSDTMFNRPLEVVGTVSWSLPLPSLPLESSGGFVGSDGDGLGWLGFPVEVPGCVSGCSVAGLCVSTDVSVVVAESAVVVVVVVVEA